MPFRMKVEQIPLMGLFSAVAMVQPPKTLRGMVGVKPLQQQAQILKSPYTVTYIGKIGHASQPCFGTRALSFENLKQERMARAKRGRQKTRSLCS